MPAENTPMKAQYNAIKARYGDCLLFFRFSPFYSCTPYLLLQETSGSPLLTARSL